MPTFANYTNFPETTHCGPPPAAMWSFWTMLSSLHLGATHAHYIFAQQIRVTMGFTLHVCTHILRVGLQLLRLLHCSGVYACHPCGTRCPTLAQQWGTTESPPEPQAQTVGHSHSFREALRMAAERDNPRVCLSLSKEQTLHRDPYTNPSYISEDIHNPWLLAYTRENSTQKPTHNPNYKQIEQTLHRNAKPQLKGLLQGKLKSKTNK